MRTIQHGSSTKRSLGCAKNKKFVAMYSCYTVIAFLTTIYLLFIPSSGTLQLLLAGYSNISTDNNALIAIPDIGTHDEGKALICRHGNSGIPPSNPIDQWNFVGVDNNEISADTTGFSISRGQNYGEVRLERRAGTYPLEGTYKCIVNVDSINEMVTVYLFWPLASFDVAIEVISQMEKIYRVSCTSFGGSLITSSLTGPDGETLGQLSLLDNQELLRGAENYSISVLRTGGDDGDVFSCNAETVNESYVVNITLSVAGPALNIKAMQVPFNSPALNISWNPPTEGATVLTYTVHYKSIDANEHSGTVNTSDETTVLLKELIADGRSYEIEVETYSEHFNGYSENIQYTPCIVSQLLIESYTSTSLTLKWDSPDYYSSNLTGLIQYRAVNDSDIKWIYILENSDTLLNITDLEEFTAYSIAMAVVDDSNKLCVFNEELIAKTGLGAVTSLQADLEEDSIEISWLPPDSLNNKLISLNYTVAYSTSSDMFSRTTETITQSHNWRIRAEQGDVYSVTVTPQTTESGEGDSTSISVGIDYKSFQIRIDGTGNCGEWIKDSGERLTSTTSKIKQILRDNCTCDVQIKEAEFYCAGHSYDFVIFRAQLFSPVTTTSSDLLSLLENWVKTGSTIEFSQSYPIDSNCTPSVDIAQSTDCITPTIDNEAVLGQESDNKESSSALLAGVAVGCVFIGIMTTLIAFLMCNIVKKRYMEKHNSVLQRRALHTLSNNDLCEANPRYTSAGEIEYPSKITHRDLPLLPLYREQCERGTNDKTLEESSLTLANHNIAQEGAHVINTGPCAHAGATEDGRAYETISRYTKENGASNSGVHITLSQTTEEDRTYETLSQEAVNPLYGDVSEPKPKLRAKQVGPVAFYETVGDHKKRERPASECEYVKMHPALSTSSFQ